MTIRSVELADAVIQTADILKAHGVIVAEVDAVREAYKARDRREPGRRQKVKFEDKLYRAVLRMFRRQRRKLLDRLQAMYPARKAIKVDGKPYPGTMIAVFVPEELGKTLVVAGGLPVNELHMTLVFLGDNKPTEDEQQNLIRMLELFSVQHDPLVGRIEGIGQFWNDENVNVLLPDLPDLPKFREDLVKYLNDYGFEFAKNHGFTPHITLSYGDELRDPPISEPVPVEFDRVVLAMGDDRYAFMLGTDKVYGESKSIKAMSTWDIDNLLSGDWDADEDAAAEIARVLVAASQHGVDLFAAGITFDMDWTMVNTDAADWARRHTYDLVKKLNDTSRVALQKNISAFIDTPGMTIGDVTKLLPFDERRSLRVAVTEITRAYGESNQIAANSLAAEFPGVRVKKRWNTNNDSLVCLICGPLNQMVVDYDAEFAPGIMVPGDAHPGDRCWMTVFTDIEDTA